jgi:serine/threonine protein kinase
MNSQVRALAGRYRALSELGCGSLGTTWLAQRVGPEGCRVLIRILTPMNDQQRLALARLRREVATLALLAHPYVARTYECEQMRDGRLYIVTEHLDGPSVAGQLVNGGPFPIADALEVASQCARVLHIGQQLGVRNRGLRLDSVFLARDATGGWQVKLRDFGLPAALAASAPVDGSAHPGDFEDISDPAASGHDVSSIGLAVYAMLTGDPWPARTGRPLGPLSAVRSDVPAVVDGLLRASLDPASRMVYESAPQFWSVLRDAVIDDGDRGDDPAGVSGPLRELLTADGLLTPNGWVSRRRLLSVLEGFKRKYRLGDLLVETNIITEEQLTVALREQQRSGQRLGELLVQLDYVSDRRLRETLCKQLGIDFVELDEIPLDRAITREIPRELATRHRALPIAREGNRLTVALEDPTNDAAVAALQQQTGCSIEVVTSEHASFWKAFSALYAQVADGPPGPAQEPGGQRRAAMPRRAIHDLSRRWVRHARGQREEPVRHEEIETALTRLQSQYEALRQEHETAIQAFRKQEEQYASLLRERQDIVDGLTRVAQQLRS